MKNKLILKSLSVVLAAQMFVTGTAHAYYTNAIGEIYANPANVYLPPNTAGYTQITWKWNKLNNNSVGTACLYVVIDSAPTASVIDCEHDDNYYNVGISWIVAPHTYNFIISTNVGTSVPATSLNQLTFKSNETVSNVFVHGVLSP
jgi:hypothetical protein